MSMNMAIDINALVDRVVTEKNVEIQITIEPDRIEVNVQPWKPYELKCPYGKEPKGE